MTAYYNENDPKAAAWLRELIRQGHIAPGDVDERSIEDVLPNELSRYKQCHFFAGIGGWSYALRLAGWPDDRAVWTGSCPCQPFSAAGQKGGTEDKRHLWPDFFRLIRECQPSTVFGEQVASKDGLAWLDIVSADLESADYAVGAADLCAAGVQAPHIRQRLWFVADSGCARLEISGANEQRTEGIAAVVARRDAGSFVNAESEQTRISGRPWFPRGTDSADWIECTDGKWRPVEPGTFPLAHGIPARMGRLRGYGNAIVPQVAAAFIEASGMV